MSGTSQLAEPRVLLDGLGMGESPRWHDGRLFLSDWGTGEIVAVDLDGNSEVVGPGASGQGWAVNWLPDGRMLITGDELIRVEPDGSRVRHADLSDDLALRLQRDDRRWTRKRLRQLDQLRLRHGIRGGSHERESAGKIALVTPDGEAREVADEIAFPNGMVVTPDNKTLVVAESFAQRLTAFDIADDGSLSNRRAWAEGIGPDGICLDADGCIWASTGNEAHDCARVREGGEILERIELDRPCFATMLGGPDRRTLFMVLNDWRGPDKIDEMIKDRTGQVLVAEAPAPGVGWP